ncbi:MAG TPA: hypothetical protein VNU26_02190 [Mycobacteriales bacterium]|nr:hypothetical protein [Mycobacteriales bacterium]
MRTWAAAVGIAAVSVAGVVTLAPDHDRPAPAPPPQPSATPTLPPLDHVDDYSAPAEDLIDHVDHLDFDRLPPDTRAELEAELARRDAVAGQLWAAYGDALLDGDPQAEPVLARELPTYELAYVLVAARAEQLAAAVARTGSIDAARRQMPDHPEVTASLDGDCVTVAYGQDPFARAFGARVGPVGAGPLLERLERSVRVGPAGAPACDGAPIALSPGAVVALGG